MECNDQIEMLDKEPTMSKRISYRPCVQRSHINSRPSVIRHERDQLRDSSCDADVVHYCTKHPPSKHMRALDNEYQNREQD